MPTPIRWYSTIGAILVPTDFSPCSLQAISAAVGLGHQCGAAVVILHVIDLDYHIPATGPMDVVSVWKELYRESRRKLEQLILDFSSEAIRLRAIILSGLPQEQICEFAQGCDLLVLGVERSKSYWRWFSRRTSEAVLGRAPCPVLVVREGNVGPTYTASLAGGMTLRAARSTSYRAFPGPGGIVAMGDVIPNTQ